MKMPSFSSCMNSSPPEDTQHAAETNTHNMTSVTLVFSLRVTAQTLQNEVQLPSRLEGVQQVHDERVPHRLQDLALCSGVSRVFSVAHDLCLWRTESGRGSV